MIDKNVFIYIYILNVSYEETNLFKLFHQFTNSSSFKSNLTFYLLYMEFHEEEI